MREMAAKESQSVRLQKVLSAAGVASRRAAEKLIADGRVTLNGVTVRRLGVCADPQSDDIRVDGRRVAPPINPGVSCRLAAILSVGERFLI